MEYFLKVAQMIGSKTGRPDSREGEPICPVACGLATHKGLNGRYESRINEDSVGNWERFVQHTVGLTERIERAKTGRPVRDGESHQVVVKTNIEETLIKRHGYLHLISDGGGGGKLPGDLASGIVINEVLKNFYRGTNLPDNPVRRFHDVAIMASDKVKGLAKGSFATLNAVIVRPDQRSVDIFNIGDSRIYRIPAGINEVQLLTKDQNVENTNIREANRIKTNIVDLKSKMKTVNPNIRKEIQTAISELQASLAELTSSIGGPELLIDHAPYPYTSGDIYVQVTDGPTEVLTGTEMGKIARKHEDNPQKAADEIIKEANRRTNFLDGTPTAGLRDNVTAQVIVLK